MKKNVVKIIKLFLEKIFNHYKYDKIEKFIILKDKKTKKFHVRGMVDNSQTFNTIEEAEQYIVNIFKIHKKIEAQRINNLKKK